MHRVEPRDLPVERLPHGRRPVNPAQALAGKVRDIHAFQVDRLQQRHRAVPRSVDIGREDMDVMPLRRERATKGMHRPNRTAVP